MRSCKISPPPVCSMRTSVTESNYGVLCEASKTLQKCNTMLNSQLDFDTEYSVLKRVIYKQNSQMRSYRGMKGLKRVESCLKRYLNIHLPSIVEEYAASILRLDVLQSSGGTVLLPSRQMVEYLLSQWMRAAMLLLQTANFCVYAFTSIYRSLEVKGELIPQNSLFLSIISRLWVLCKCLYGSLEDWYGNVYVCLDVLESTQASWLPTDQVLPKDLSIWMTKEIVARVGLGSEEELMSYVKDPEKDRKKPVNNNAFLMESRETTQVDDIGAPISRADHQQKEEQTLVNTLELKKLQEKRPLKRKGGKKRLMKAGLDEREIDSGPSFGTKRKKTKKFNGDKIKKSKKETSAQKGKLMSYMKDAEEDEIADASILRSNSVGIKLAHIDNMEAPIHRGRNEGKERFLVNSIECQELSDDETRNTQKPSEKKRKKEMLSAMIAETSDTALEVDGKRKKIQKKKGSLEKGESIDRPESSNTKKIEKQKKIVRSCHSSSVNDKVLKKRKKRAKSRVDSTSPTKIKSKNLESIQQSVLKKRKKSVLSNIVTDSVNCLSLESPYTIASKDESLLNIKSKKRSKIGQKILQQGICIPVKGNKDLSEKNKQTKSKLRKQKFYKQREGKKQKKNKINKGKKQKEKKMRQTNLKN
ncbi:hypothetical protein ScPMuIL_014611 [Solemya velum]